MTIVLEDENPCAISNIFTISKKCIGIYKSFTVKSFM
jgi:hypothetical protein